MLSIALPSASRHSSAEDLKIQWSSPLIKILLSTTQRLELHTSDSFNKPPTAIKENWFGQFVSFIFNFFPLSKLIYGRSVGALVLWTAKQTRPANPIVESRFSLVPQACSARIETREKLPRIQKI